MKNINKIVDKRPWGGWEKFVENKECTVKIISVNPNSKLSYQYHHHREEFGRVISGQGQIMIDDKIIDVKEGDEFYIPVKAKHRAMTTDWAMQYLEIALGDFDENDIVRLEDDYNRK